MAYIMNAFRCITIIDHMLQYDKDRRKEIMDALNIEYNEILWNSMAVMEVRSVIHKGGLRYLYSGIMII